MHGTLVKRMLSVETRHKDHCVQKVHLTHRTLIMGQTLNDLGRTMASRAKIDERGRPHIPTSEREKASIPLDSGVLVVPKSPGHIELILVGEARLEQFQKNNRGRLKQWKEEDHKADKALEELGSDRHRQRHPKFPDLSTATSKALTLSPVLVYSSGSGLKFS